ncbi:hypothetical protein [Actinocorallia longicatena]|uniref:Oxidoreductase n=1 Tax=Actinocorallia longicatena TaxID=111803 RepID=A0ABP6QF23_9ACTN
MALTAAEQRLWRAYPIGATVDLGGGSVSASVIVRLLLGACEPRKGFVPQLRLENATVVGALNVSGGTVGCDVRLKNCILDTAPDFSNAQVKQLRLLECSMPGFEGAGMRAERAISLSGSVIDGQVNLVRAQFLSGLWMKRTRITNTGGPFAFYSGSMVVDGGMFAQESVITGGMRLVGSRLNAGLFLQGARLVNPGRLALDAQNIIAADAVECSAGFTSEGRIKLRNAQVNGTLSFDQAGPMSNPGHIALHLSHMQVTELILSPSAPIEGMVSLRYSRVGVVLDRYSSWPASIDLDGLVYETLRAEVLEHDRHLKSRIDWVNRAPEFRSQPYEQLSAWFLREGHEHLARKTQLMKFRRRRAKLPWPSRTWSALLDYTVGYGYRPWQAAAWLAVLITVGTIVFSVEQPRPLREPAELPDFHALAYVVDLLIPISAFGLRDTWNPVGWTQWLAYGIIASGWILATALIAGVTRVLKPN